VLRGIALRKLSLLVVLAGVLTPWASTQAQDQPSVADAARAARESKEKSATSATQPKKVLTNDDVASSKTSGDTGSLSVSSIAVPKSSGTSSAGGSFRTSAGDDSPTSKAWEGIGRAEDSLDRLAPLDRATLAKVVLEGHDVDFPGRHAWEEKLFIAKERYVAHSRQLINEMTQLMQGAQSLQNSDTKLSPDNPQAQQLAGRAQQLLSDATNTEAAFKSVMQEGLDRAAQGPPR
jgi:hypothetical protein